MSFWNYKIHFLNLEQYILNKTPKVSYLTPLIAFANNGDRRRRVEEMRALYDAQRRAHETVLTLQAQIEEEEAVYLEETPHGNIIRGWDGFIDSKQPRKDANPKKIKPYSESEHLSPAAASTRAWRAGRAWTSTARPRTRAPPRPLGGTSSRSP